MMFATVRAYHAKVVGDIESADDLERAEHALAWLTASAVTAVIWVLAFLTVSAGLLWLAAIVWFIRTLV